MKRKKTTIKEEIDQTNNGRIKLIKALTKAGGKLPSQDKKTYTELVNALIADWKIKKTPELMMVNRMVSTWMKMSRVEELMKEYDLFFERRDEHGTLIGVQMNQLAFYLKSLESDFRNYYKALTAGKSIVTEEKDFHDFINMAPINEEDETGSDKAED